MSATNPENGTVTYTYDNNLHPASKTDAKGQKVTYAYDSAGRPTDASRFPSVSQNEDASQHTYYLVLASHLGLEDTGR